MMEQEELLTNIITEYLTEIPTIINRKTSKKDIKFEYRNEYYNMTKIIDNYINENETHKRFLVLPGIRGVGKTTLLYQIYEYLFKEKNIPLNQILYLSCDDINRTIRCDLRQIVELYLKNYHRTTPRLLKKKIFLLIDEAQYDKNWALLGKTIYDKTDNIFMIFTGSSALNIEYSADAKRRSKKIQIPPLTYPHHLKLKYKIHLKTSQEIKDMIFTGNINKIQNKEFKIKNMLINNLAYTENDWINYILYGGYPVNYDETDLLEIRDKLVETIEKVIDTDMPMIKNINKENLTNADRIIRYLALQDSNETSMDKISKYLKTSSSNVKLILNTLEKTHIIFHCEPYGTSSKRTRKTWKYYFATSSLKNALISKIGNTNKNQEKYEGILLENLVASKLYQINDDNKEFTLYYDSNKKGNVDFIVHKEFTQPIPIEVGRGKKDKKQIKEAIHNYKSEHGILISNKTEHIEKEDDIIYIPPKTFALL